MKVRIFKKVETAIWRVSIYTEEWSEADIQKMEKYGEPEIDLGGDFENGSETVMHRDSRLVKVKTESPFTAAFDSRDEGINTEAYANLWAAMIVARLDAAVTALRARTDTFTAETVEEI